MLSRADLIAVLDRTTDPSWLAPLLADTDSAAVLNAIADVFSRVSLSGENTTNAGMISLAPGDRPGVNVITLTGPGLGGATTIPKGFTWIDDRGFVAVTTLDIPVPALATMVNVPVETIRHTELVNSVDDPLFQPQASPPNPAVILAFIQANFPTITALPTIGGTTDFLSGHGRERGQQRQQGEAEEHYRLRIRNIPDSVSPKAVVEAVQAAAQQAFLPPITVYEPEPSTDSLAVTDATNASPIVIETSTVHGLLTGNRVRVTGVQGNTAANDVWFVTNVDDTHFSLDGSTGSGAYTTGGRVDELPLEHLDFFLSTFTDADFFDDPSVEMVSRREACAYLRIEPDTLPRDPDDLRPFLDHMFFDDPVYGFTDIQDHPVLLAGLLSVIEEVNRKRAACVQFDEFLPGIVTKEAPQPPDTGITSAAVLTLVWTLTPPAGKIWLYVDGIFGHTPDPVGAEHSIKFLYDDATSGSSPLYTDPDSQRISRLDLNSFGGGPLKRITSIEGYLKSDGVTPVTLLGAARVVEVTI